MDTFVVIALVSLITAGTFVGISALLRWLGATEGPQFPLVERTDADDGHEE